MVPYHIVPGDNGDAWVEVRGKKIGQHNSASSYISCNARSETMVEDEETATVRTSPATYPLAIACRSSRNRNETAQRSFLS
jgi:molecular chaperone DnaK